MASDNLIFLGIGLGVFASMTGTIGKQLLRLSELALQSGNVHRARMALAVGLALNTAIGPIVDMLSYMFAPQSLIAPLGGLDVVWNTMIAPCVLGEKLTCLVIFGVVCIAAGATCTSFFGNHDDKEYNVQVIQDTFIRPVVLIYLCVLVVWILINVFLLQPRSANPKGEPWASGDPIRGLSLGLTAGSIAGNMFCVKGFIELVQSSIRDGDADVWTHWLTYILLIGAVIFAVTNLLFLTKAMREYEALFMGAVFEGSLIVCACVSGMIVYKDLENLSWVNILMYFLALSGIVFGIFMVAIGCFKPDDEQPVNTEEKEALPPSTSAVVAVQFNGSSSKIDQPSSVESSTSAEAHGFERPRLDSKMSNTFSLTRTLSKRTTSTRTFNAEKDSLESPFSGSAAQSFDLILAQLSSRSRVQTSPTGDLMATQISHTSKALQSPKGALAAWSEESTPADIESTPVTPN